MVALTDFHEKHFAQKNASEQKRFRSANFGVLERSNGWTGMEWLLIA
jgi:hypothetical protein